MKKIDGTVAIAALFCAPLMLLKPSCKNNLSVAPVVNGKATRTVDTEEWK